MLSNLVHMLEMPNKASRPNGTRFGVEQLDQNTPKTLSGYFKLLKYLKRKYSPKIPGKFYHVIYDIFDDLAKPHALKIKETSFSPVKTILSIFEV